jgi:hypothetical protein
MEDWKTAIQRGIWAGDVASALSTLVLAGAGKCESDSITAPTNAISHWVWGDEAARHNEPSLRYTLTGYLIHHISATFWAVLCERFLGSKLDKQNLRTTLAASSAVSVVACFTDYQLTPKRLRPGYEKRLSIPALALVYGAFALGLAVGAISIRRKID